MGGASKYASQKFGIELEREQGEKWGDYLVRISDNALASKTEKLTLKEQELEEQQALAQESESQK